MPATTKHVGELLCSQVAEDRRRNWKNLIHILQVVWYLARQGLPLRGSSLNHEFDSNFSQLLQVLCTYDDSLSCWLKKKTDKYTSADIQNELLQVMAHHILREIATNVHDRPFSVKVDETTDASTQEQCVIILRWVDDNLESHEDFIGLYVTSSTSADSIVSIILIHMNGKLSN